jgi:hypothetical protein
MEQELINRIEQRETILQQLESELKNHILFEDLQKVTTETIERIR